MKKRQSIFLVIVVLLTTPTFAIEFAGGTGEPNDPYQIATAEQFIKMLNQKHSMQHYVLISDLDFSVTPGIGVSSECSYCETHLHLDGRGHTIRNYNNQIINGFFGGSLLGIISQRSVIQNLTLENAEVYEVYTQNSVSGILSPVNQGAIINCNVAGIYASSMGETTLGGLVGRNEGLIQDCNVNVAVYALSYVSCAGGMVGINEGYIINSQSGSEMFVDGVQGIGGLVGINSGWIDGSFATGQIYSGWRMGGLVGLNVGFINDCYATGDVWRFFGGDSMGRLVGTLRGGCLSRCYAIGNVYIVTEAIIHDSFVGEGDPNLIESCYYLSLIDVNENVYGFGKDLTAEQMMQKENYVGWNFVGTDVDSSANTWFMPEGSYPVLNWQRFNSDLIKVPDVTGLSVEEAEELLNQAGFALGVIEEDYHQTVPESTVIRTKSESHVLSGAVIDIVVSLGSYDWNLNEGDGTEAHPYQLSLASQLISFSDHPELWQSSFEVINDIDLAESVFSQALIAPDINDVNDGFQGESFAGHFNGKGHVISNLTMVSGKDYLGLFGQAGSEAVIESLNIIDARIQGTTESNRVAILTGENQGTIDSCHVNGLISGYDIDTGFAAINTGTIVNSTDSIKFIRYGPVSSPGGGGGR